LALKVMTGQPDAQAARRFAREAEIAARVQHPRLVSVVDVGVTDSGAMFLAMELVEGRSLESERARFGEPAWGLPVLADVAEGLAELHRAGVVHRDLKPGNVLLDAGGRAQITDFGIARWWSEHESDLDILGDTLAPSGRAQKPRDVLTRSGVLIGTPIYIAPELAHGGQRAPPSSDVFSFGVMAWEVLTGQRPWPGPAIFLVLSGTPLVLPSGGLPISGPAAELLTASIDGDPLRRPSAEALARGLRQASAASSTP
jgi:serine/threonine protein kinase